MIYEHGGLALNLFNIKAVKKEITRQGGCLIFEFHNMIRNIETVADSNVWEERAFENASITQCFDDPTDLELHYEEWVGIWTQFTEYVINLNMNIDFKPNRI